MKLSIVIPVYNAEKYLGATVDSILAQDYDDYEIILVNDGSKDESGNLCNQLAERYDKISVIHKSNGGVSSARNAGIDAARGKYIAFVDSDDAVGEHMFSDMLSEMERNNADYVFCGLEEIQSNGDRAVHIADLPPRQLLDRNTVIDVMLFAGCSGDSYMNSVCGSVFKTELIRNHNLKFENRPMGEDWLFNMKYCDIIKTAVYVNEPYYKYLRNADSAVSRYQARQFDLWLENRAFRAELITKYDFKIDRIAVDSIWITKVFFYSLEVIKHDADYKNKLSRMFRNEDFKSALSNAKKITPMFFTPVVLLLKSGCSALAITLLRFYSHCIR